MKTTNNRPPRRVSECEPRVWVASGGTREQLLNNPLAALLVAVGDRIVVKTEEGESDGSDREAN